MNVILNSECVLNIYFFDTAFKTCSLLKPLYILATKSLKLLVGCVRPLSDIVGRPI